MVRYFKCDTCGWWGMSSRDLDGEPHNCTAEKMGTFQKTTFNACVGRPPDEVVSQR